MGEYSNLYIAGCNVDFWKDHIGHEAAILFTEDDLTETDHPYRRYEDGEGEENEANLRDQQENEKYDEDQQEQLRGYQYRSTAANIIDRLEVMGYTIIRAKEHFEKGISQVLKDREELEHILTFKELKAIEPVAPYGSYEAAVKFYEGYTFDMWINLIKEVFDKKLKQIYSFNNKGQFQREQNPYLYHVLEYRDEHNFGFPGSNPDYMYRAMLEVVEPNTPVVLNFSALVGWVGPEWYQCQPPKVVILTEGSSDKQILENALRILYPHLYHYYSFIDFDLANMPGSAGHLLNMVKAFVTTGVNRRTIAIFDNDTAGHEALRQLAKVPLAEDIKVMTLPRLDLAACYPTVGPQGRINIDINGLACSIELYLGRNILENVTGELSPIRWGGLMPGTGRYQGEIQNKTDIQEKYLRLLSDVESNPELMKTHDWCGIKLVLESIFDQFRHQPPIDEYIYED